MQDDPAIHYHLRDLFTGEMYVRPGDDLARRGFVVGLAPHELHLLEVEDISVEDNGRGTHPRRAPRRLRVPPRLHQAGGVVGDIHGELQALKDIIGALGCGSFIICKRPTVGTSITGEYSLPPSRLIRTAASSSFGTPTYIAQKGGAVISCGFIMTPATGAVPLRLKIVNG